MRCLRVGPREATLVLPYRDDLVGDPTRGVVFGGVITTLLDQAGGVAPLGSLPELTSIATVDLRIDYLRAAKPGRGVEAIAVPYALGGAISIMTNLDTQVVGSVVLRPMELEGVVAATFDDLVSFGLPLFLGRALFRTSRDLRDLIEQSVRIRLRADVPVGAYLSGGLDSSLVTSMAAKWGKLPCYTGAYAEGPQYDERPHARRVTGHLGLPLHARQGPAATELQLSPAGDAENFPGDEIGP